jgi:predicted GNAT family N-acyltransferase
MSNSIYKIDSPSSFSLSEKEEVLHMLVKQNKVLNPSVEKLNNCKLLCVCFIDTKMVSIGAIKPKTTRDFNKDKANLPNQSDNLTWELGYCFTDPSYTSKGYSSMIVKQLIEKFGDHNLMATTELREDNPMGHILGKFGFEQHGATWKSGIHQGEMGLFLRLTK